MNAFQSSNDFSEVPLEETSTPTLPPTIINAEELHEEDAYAAVFLNVVLIICVLLAYCIKQNKIYYLPER